ncbi:MAG: hypothetical protein IJW31_07475, partial [Lentisphaeria bacterium]|nr:hypothetical protein [Lentisphaeria bacterium]
NAVPTPLRKVSDLDQKRCENFSNFHISKFFIHIHGRRQQLFQPPAIFCKIAEKLKSFRLSTPAFKKSVERSRGTLGTNYPIDLSQAISYLNARV